MVIADGTHNEMTNDNTPLISVVMGVYNGAADLRATIDSILDQTLTEIELIIVNDGSTDDSATILGDYVTKDPRVVVIEQSNAGLTQALTTGCQSARASIIARQDVGDRSLKHRLEYQLKFLQAHPEVVAVGAGCRRIGPKGEYLGEAARDLTPTEVTQAFLDSGVGISHTVAMFRHDAYRHSGGYRKQFRFAQDTDLWHRMSMIGNLAELPEILFEWGIDCVGISSTSHDRQRRLAMLARESYELLKAGKDDSDVLLKAETASWGELPPGSVIPPRVARANAEFFIGSQLYSIGDPRCRSYLKQAIRHRPCWGRPWAKLALSFLSRKRSGA